MLGVPQSTMKLAALLVPQTVLNVRLADPVGASGSME
jgi:hypothetical protein